ncbi:MAG: reverse transcriptase family protein, partial [Pseudomonadota bacterium]
MTRAELARNLAVSATRGEWSVEAVEAALRRRLPDTLRRLAFDIATDVLETLPGSYAPAAKRVAKALITLAAFDTIWRYCRRYEAWPERDLRPASMAPIRALCDLDIPNLGTACDLAEWLILTPERLEYLADPTNRHERHDEMAVNHYHYNFHAKRGAGVRLIEAPKPGLKAVQRLILRGILNHLPAHADAFGFVAGRNCAMAANRHTGEEVVLRFDLKDFFPSIHAGRVFGLFRCLGYPHAVSRFLTGLCTNATPPRMLARLAAPDRATYRAPHLPQGAPTSPVLANQMCFALDRRLSGLARGLGANYSRYADDLSFSGDARIVQGVLDGLPRIAAAEGFHLNTQKTQVMRHGAQKSVT